MALMPTMMFGAFDVNRTHNLPITSRTHYQLCYEGKKVEWLIHSYLHEAQCDALGNKEPCLHVADGVINLVAGVGIEPTTSRL